MPLGMEVSLGPGDIVLDGDPAPASSPSPLQKGHSSPPYFLAHVFCGQMAGWIRILVGTEVGLSPGHIVLDGDPALPTDRGTAALAPRFSARV